MNKKILGVLLVLTILFTSIVSTKAEDTVNKKLDTEDIDVVVVGGGPGGLSAAIESAVLGNKVIVLADRPVRQNDYYAVVDRVLQREYPRQSEDRLSEIRSLTTRRSTSVEHRQMMRDLAVDLDSYNQGIYKSKYYDGEDLMILENYAKGEYLGDLDLINRVFSHSMDTKFWLEQQGILWEDKLIEGTDYRGIQPVGGSEEYTRVLREKAVLLGVQVVEDLKVEDLFRKHQDIVSVVTTDGDGNRVDIDFSKGVVLATGSYIISDRDFENYWRRDQEFLVGDPEADGLGYRLAKDVGAEFKGMEYMDEISRDESTGDTLYIVNGGVTTNEYLQVIDEYGDVIPGLYATGDLVYGLYGMSRNENTTLTSDIVLGRMVGQSIGLGLSD